MDASRPLTEAGERLSAGITEAVVDNLRRLAEGDTWNFGPVLRMSVLTTFASIDALRARLARYEEPQDGASCIHRGQFIDFSDVCHFCRADRYRREAMAARAWDDSLSRGNVTDLEHLKISRAYRAIRAENVKHEEGA